MNEAQYVNVLWTVTTDTDALVTVAQYGRNEYSKILTYCGLYTQYLNALWTEA